MNLTRNPWRPLIVLLVLAVLIVCICIDCAGITDAEEKTSGDRFVIEAFQSKKGVGETLHFYVLKDTETGVRYLFVDGAYGADLIPLEEAPGEEADR